MTTPRRSSSASSDDQRSEASDSGVEDSPAAAESDAADTDELKAKFRAALKHKEHHDGPGVGGSGSGTGRLHESPHGAPSTKREFRRKTG